MWLSINQGITATMQAKPSTFVLSSGLFECRGPNLRPKLTPKIC